MGDEEQELASNGPSQKRRLWIASRAINPASAPLTETGLLRCRVDKYIGANTSA